MPDLVALDLDGGPAFVDTLVAVWERGDAVCVLDRRLPAPAAAELLGTLRPGAVIDASGERRLEGGLGVERGDALVVATSGSLGTRRAAVLTHEAVAASARATSAAAGVEPTRSSWLCCLPLAHIGGLSVVTRAVLTATPVTVLPAFDASVVEAFGRRKRGATGHLFHQPHHSFAASAAKVGHTSQRAINPLAQSGRNLLINLCPIMSGMLAVPCK